jgi:hypothetical protein
MDVSNQNVRKMNKRGCLQAKKQNKIYLSKYVAPHGRPAIMECYLLNQSARDGNEQIRDDKQSDEEI